MKKIDELFAKIKKNKARSEDLKEKEFKLLDELHQEVLSTILKDDLFRKMKWRLPVANYKYPKIERVDATKDDNWKKIEKLLDKAGNISWATTYVSLSDHVVMDIEGGVVSLLPRQRDTNGQRGVKIPITDNKKYFEFMNQELLAFVKKYKLVVDFSEIEAQRLRLLDDVKSVEDTISACRELNASLTK